MADLIAQATDPAPLPEETEEKNNEQRPANTAGGAAVVCDPAATAAFSLNTAAPHCCFSCSTIRSPPPAEPFPRLSCCDLAQRTVQNVFLTALSYVVGIPAGFF